MVPVMSRLKPARLTPATHNAGEFTGVEVKIDAAERVRVHAVSTEPLVLHVATISRYLAPPLAAPLGQE